MAKARRGVGETHGSRGRNLLLIGASLLGVSSCSSVDQLRLSLVMGEERLDQSKNYYASGREHFLSGRYGLAIQAFHMSLMKDGDDPDTLNALGASYDQLRRFDLALKYYGRALARRAESPSILNNIGYSLLLQGEPDRSVRYLRRARDLGGPNLSVIEANLSNAQLSSERAAMADANAPAMPRERKPEAALRRTPEVWLQRTTRAVVTLVTRPNQRFVARAESENVDPALVMHRREAHYRPEPPVRREVPDPVTIAATMVEPFAPYPVWVPAMLVRTTAARPLPNRPLPPAPSSGIGAGTPRIKVANGAGRRHMARRMERYLQARGWAVAALSNASHFGYRKTVIFVRPNFRGQARALADLLPNEVEIRDAWPSQDVDILIRLGADYLDFDAKIWRRTRDA